MSLYLCHRGAFIRQPLKCRAAPRCSNVRRMARAVRTYGRPRYLPRGWLSDLLEDLNILWARENWICQGAVLLLCASFQVFDTDMSLCPSQWAKMLPLSGGKEQRWHLRRVTHETWAQRLNITRVSHHQLANKTDFKKRNRNVSLAGAVIFQTLKFKFKCTSLSSNECFPLCSRSDDAMLFQSFYWTGILLPHWRGVDEID